jgi:hypothetical protein
MRPAMSVLGVMTFLGLLAATAAAQGPSDQEKAAAESLRVLGARVDVNEDGHVTLVSGSWQRPFGDRDMVHVAYLPHLRRLDLSEKQITDEGLSQLKGLASLESLSLSSTGITDAGLASQGQRALCAVLAR